MDKPEFKESTRKHLISDDKVVVKGNTNVYKRNIQISIDESAIN